MEVKPGKAAATSDLCRIRAHSGERNKTITHKRSLLRLEVTRSLAIPAAKAGAMMAVSEEKTQEPQTGLRSPCLYERDG